MGVIKKKPYEISIWEDRLVTENDISYYKEVKLAVIGSDQMESPNRAFDPVLIENVNGEKTLTFSIAYKYHDEYSGEIVTNPFYKYLINERKIKLFYNGEWNEFLIKECEEGSSEYIFNYTAKELFSLELAKLGYDVTLDTSLNNNQGTIIELAKKVLENTDWEVDEDNSDLLKQYVQEPLYAGVITAENGVEVINLDNNQLITIQKDEIIYLFYSYIKDKITTHVQFIRKTDEPFTIDDDNVIMSTNYRFQTPIEYTIDSDTGEVTGIDGIAVLNSLYTSNQGYRLVYKIQTTYDPIMNRTVDIYQMPYGDGIQEIYHFLDYNYTTSDLVMSYITNGSNFELLEDGKIQGWYNTTPTSLTDEDFPTLQQIRSTTYPELSASGQLQFISALLDINGFVEMKFNGILTDDYKNTYFNEGFEHSATMIDHVSAGEKFALRTKFYTSDAKHGDLTAAAPTGDDEGLRVIVAKYEVVDQECYLNPKKEEESEESEETDELTVSENTEESENTNTESTNTNTSTEPERTTSKIKAYKILEDEILLDFNEAFIRSPNIINNGTFAENNTQYIVDKVIQVPSTFYIYMQKGDDTEYIWDNEEGKYVALQSLTENTTEDSNDSDDAAASETQEGTQEESQENQENQNESQNEEQKEQKVPFSDYYITTATAKYSLTNEEMSDPKLRLGIFLYTKDSELVDKYVYLQDIQLTRYYEDANKNPITIGNVPTAESHEVDRFYLKPTTQISAKEINTYGTLDALANELGANVGTITPVYNENSEKILSIQASHSNYFNILQDLCETFECWLDIRVAHDEDGSIKLDKDFNPIKRVAFKEYAGKDNFAGFKSGINLSDISRTIDSNEIVTKLIVEPVQSEYSDTGSIEIQRAKTNVSGQSYILNFSYYLNRGLINENIETFNDDLNKYYLGFAKLNEDIIALQDKQVQVSKSLTRLSAERNTYTALIAKAEKMYNKAIEDFQKLTNWEYEAFVSEYQNLEEWARREPDKAKNYLENDTVLDVVAEIYTSTVTLNNYGGILTNLDEEYRNVALECYGAKEYGISVIFIPGNGADVDPSTQVTVDDYVSGLTIRLIGKDGLGRQNSVILRGSPNDRIFKASNEFPYQMINFMNLPDGYALKYYNHNSSAVIEDGYASMNFNIYDAVTDETYNRRFSLVPKADYAAEHKGIQEKIDELIAQKEELEKEFYKKYSRFLQEGTWSSQDYIDPELYYFDALQVSSTSAQPKVSYTINVLEVSQIDGLENYDFRVGDKTYVEDTDFFGYIYQSINVNQLNQKDPDASTRAPLEYETQYENDLSQEMIIRTPVREEVIVSEVEWHFDEPDNNTITIQNYKTRFEDLFQRISATVQTVQRNEITYPKTTSILDQSGLINSALLANSLNGIGNFGFALTTNGSVAATEDGLMIRDLLNPSNVMRLASSGLQLSTDGGNNWKTAVNAEGISAETLTAGTINTQRIWLMDGNNPSFRWDKAGLNAYGYDENGENSYDLKTYVRFDKYGLYGIKNDEDYVASSLDEAVKRAYFSVTWKGFTIKNSYEGGGQVEITSENDFRVLKDKNNSIEKIKIGALEWNDSSGNITTNPENGVGAPTLYGIRILNDAGAEVMKTGDDGNLTISGTINALAGNFTGQVNVGDPSDIHIVIDGSTANPTISSSNYIDNGSLGWTIDSNGDAIFSNVSVRGAIKTAVFEYEEIQAVGGAFLFRPSSTIKSARYESTPTEITVIDEEDEEETETVTVDYLHDEDGTIVYNDLILTVEKPLQFRKYNWVKISNYNGSEGATAGQTGLVHIYEVSDIASSTTLVDVFEPVINPTGNPSGQGYYELVEDEYILSQDTTVDESKTYYLKDTAEAAPTYELTLAGGCAVLEEVDLNNIAGGALIDFGNVQKTQNYGIGINSSDDYINLPARAISLFETTINSDPNATIRVSYNYRGILGTLPLASQAGLNVDSNIYSHMENKQGIYTDNMYIGDASGYVAFYKTIENNMEKGHLKVQGDITATSLTIAPGAEVALTYNVEIKATEIDYTTNTATLVAIAYNHGEPMTDEVAYTWYQDDMTHEIEYVKTQDTAIEQDKNYYVYNNGQYVLVTEPDVEDIDTYYEEYESSNTLYVTDLAHTYICVISTKEGD